jgi:hypothetical protein
MILFSMYTLPFKSYRLYSYPFLAAIMYLLFMLINPTEGYFEVYATYKLIDYVIEISLILFFTSITVESGIIVTKVLNRYIPWEIAPQRRIVVQLLVQVGLLIFIFTTLFTIFEGEGPIAPTTLNDELVLRQAWVIGVLISLLNTAVFTAEYFFTQLNKSRMESIQLRQNATQAQLDALKSQIDPHFLFNNFSTLTTLIEEDRELSVKFVHRLSQVYRYLLSNRSQNVVPLGDELGFITAYFFLYQMRYGTAIQLEINVSFDNYKKGIAPVTLQLLLENAIKHNVLSEKEPLIVKIYEEGKFLVVENCINPKVQNEPSSKMGLNNILERYKLLSVETPIVMQSSNLFLVKVPLLIYGN